MRCSKCKECCVLAKPALCKEHFISYFESKVKDTIKRYGLLEKKDKVCVAVSGGKDSMSLLYLLNKLGYEVTGLAIDEGISGYRDITLKKLKKICKQEDIPYRIVSFKDNFGKTLDTILKDRPLHPCTVCGIFRRNLLNKYSQGFDAIATGHNLDDEAQAVLMNIAKSNLSVLSRIGPVSGKETVENFTKRVKPFYLCTEKEIMTYSFIMKLTTDFKECPNVAHSFRHRIRDFLNDLEQKKPGSKKNLIEWFLKNKGQGLSSKKVTYCTVCGEPSSNKICNTCKYIEKIK